MKETPQHWENKRKDKKSGIEDYKEIQTWLRTVSENSRSLYLSSMKKFLAFSGKTPRELVEERDRELRDPDHNNRTGIRDLILDFRVFLEKEGFAGKTINTLDGAVRGYFTAVLGKGAMINVNNYRNAQLRQKKDLVPTLEELKKILDVSTLEEKSRIIFLAQTGMRISDALGIKIGDIQRELDIGMVPLAILYLPEKDRAAIGERITFLASDGVEILKAYLRWRKDIGEEITSSSPLFSSRTNRGVHAVTKQMANLMFHNVAKKAGLNGDWKYGVLRAHSFRKFFITQMTNHGVQDKVVDFFVGHAVSEVDRVYWTRRIYDLRKIYADRQQHLNPISMKPEVDLSRLEGMKTKIKELETRLNELANCNTVRYETRIVECESDVARLVAEGFDFQVLTSGKWLMRRPIK